ncbi:MAG: hypothetical protein WC635_04365 [Bacteriovorax sp.]|jgi:DNA-binding response OmpR family regulator
MVKPKDNHNDQMKRIFYVEKAEFLRSMMEFALKARGAEIYTLDTLENNFYLLDDLRPQLILFDVETCRDHLQRLSDYSPNVVMVGVGNEENKKEVEGMVNNFILKPFEARNLAANILALLD